LPSGFGCECAALDARYEWTHPTTQGAFNDFGFWPEPLWGWPCLRIAAIIVLLRVRGKAIVITDGMVEV
jgi:hypothetical protein